jgi:hypothetical protein
VEFTPIRRGPDLKPVLAARAKHATLSIPGELAKTASLSDGKIRVGIGQEGRARYLQVVNDPAGDFQLTRRGSNLVLTAKELMPANRTEAHSKGVELSIHSTNTGLVLPLPNDWQMAR